jgi:hypothetical protein
MVLRAKWVVAGAFVVGFLLAAILWIRSLLPTYPYGWSHCCLKQLGFALLQYAADHDRHFPAGAQTPEASLSLLYQEDYGVDAELLRGKTVPVAVVRGLLERGQLLGPETCGWHYVEGLTLDDDPQIALVWDKVGLGHNGEELSRGGHEVLYVGGWTRIVPASEWPDFLEGQARLLAARDERSINSTADHRQNPMETVVQADLDGKQFRSLELGESGLGQEGMVMGHWYLTFRDGSVFWDYSDVRDGARYHLKADGSITANVGNPPDQPVRAQYDKAADRIFWDGMWYERVSSETRPADK